MSAEPKLRTEDEMKAEMLREISSRLKDCLEPEAHARWERISLVNQARAQSVADKVFQAKAAGSKKLDDATFQKMLMAEEKKASGSIQFLRKGQDESDSDDDDDL